MRVNGKFVDAEGNRPEGQIVRRSSLHLVQILIRGRRCCSTFYEDALVSATD